jgi:two-component system, OmpR family, sensor histidine kinase SenX3
MKWSGKCHLSSFLIIIMLLPLVVLLAVLQYRWLGQISESEREKKHINLQKDAQRFGEEFDQEITQAYLHFQLDGNDINRDNLSNFSEYYDRWVNQASHPRLVRNLWLVTMEVKKSVVSIKSLENTSPVHFSATIPSVVVTSKMDQTVLRLKDGKRAGLLQPRGEHGAVAFTAGGYISSGIHVNSRVNIGSIGLDTLQAFHISHFNRESGRFEATAWPAELEKLRQRLETERKKGSPIYALQHSLLKPVDEDSLSLIIPVYRYPTFFYPVSPGKRLSGASNPSYRFVVVALNINYIRHELIPALARRYFANGSAEGGLEYNLSIISRLNPHSPIFASDPQAARDSAASADATTNLFGVRFWMYRNRIKSAILGPPLLRFKNSPSHDAVEVGVVGTSIPAIPMPMPILKYSLPENTAATTADSAKVQMKNGPLVLPQDDLYWQLSLKHRAGSLDLAIAQFRRRNLVVSFGILLLLVVSVIIIFISSQRARRLARQQVEFVAGVSHELRTPLAVISMTGSNLAYGRIRDFHKVKQYGELIQAEGRRLAEMIELILSYAGADDKTSSMSRVTVDVASIIDNALAAIRPQMEEKGVVCLEDISHDLPPINVNARSIEHAVQNLLSNAVKYSGESRYIRLKAQLAKSRYGDEEIQITVQDYGLGIKPEELPEIFEPFRRGREVIEMNIAGTGLGLSLVRQIMEAHGGRVSVDSVYRQGSAFTLHLPASRQEMDNQ